MRRLGIFTIGDRLLNALDALLLLVCARVVFCILWLRTQNTSQVGLVHPQEMLPHELGVELKTGGEVRKYEILL